MSATLASDADVDGTPERQQQQEGLPGATSDVLLAEIGDDEEEAIQDETIPGAEDESDESAIVVGGDVGMQDDEETTSRSLRTAPSPSAKRHESESTLRPPSDAANPKKRKRGLSPPWTFPTAETTTLKTADGRRISARVNTSTPGISDSDAARGRSSSLSAPPVTLNTPLQRRSPPWKRFEAEGPTSLVVDGKRKSGRVNKELGETPKRVSPRSAKKHNVGLGSSGMGDMKEQVGRPKSTATAQSAKAAKDTSRPSSSSDSALRIAHLRAQIEALQPTRSFPSEEQQSKRGHNRKASNTDDAVKSQTSPHRTTSPNSARSRPPLSPDAHRPSPKIRLRFNGPRRIIPPPHPSARMPPPVLPPRPSMFQMIESFELLEMQQPYTENERGPPDAAWFVARAEKMAAEEGAMRQRILREAEEGSGGMLTKEKLSIFQNAAPQPEPPKQYGPHDYMVAHALHLRHLQLKEKQAHRALAKKVAHEALERWKVRNGPTEEDLRIEERKMLELMWKQIQVDIRAKWDMVAAYIQRKRLLEWEEKEEERRQERLKEKLKRSEMMVARQRGNDKDSDDSSMDDENDDDSASGEENMSETSEEVEEKDGEMVGAELDAYLAQRKAEAQKPLDKRLKDVDKDDGVDDSTMTSEVPTPTSKEDTLAALFAEDAMDVDEDELSAQDFQSEEVSKEPDDFADLTQADGHTASRRSRRSSVSHDVDEDAAGLSSDESTDMDSTDYDSDEDMSSTGDEADVEDGANGGDGEEGGDASGDEQAVPQNSLLSLFKDEVKKWAGLPTPTTSAEGDEGEHVAEAQDDAGTAQDEMKPVEEQLRQDSLQDDMLDHHPSSAHASPEPASSVDEHSAARHLVPSPALLRGTLRSYQHAGLDWLASLYRAGTNGILADEMGLGKTIQTISLLAHLAEEHEVWEAHLVIVPTSVILNWVTEFQKFLPGFRVLGYYGTAEERQAKRKGWVNDPHHVEKDKRGYNVVVTSYNVAMQDINAIRNVQWHYLVLDEAHNIRNFNSQRWQVLIRLKTRARLLLTGTPLQNSLTELWSLLTFLTAGDDDPAHGDLEEFLSHWKEPVREIFDRGVATLSTEAQRVVDQLHVSLRPFLLRRLKSEVEKDLPKKTEEVVVCKLSKRQRQLYQEYMGLADTKRSLAHGNAVSAGRVLLSLRRVCNHPDLFDPRAIQTSFAVATSALEGFDAVDEVVRALLGKRDETVPSFLRLVDKESLRGNTVKRSRRLNATKRLEIEARELEAKNNLDEATHDPSTMSGCRTLQRMRVRKEKLEHVRSCITISKESFDAAPVYGTDLRELVTVKNGRSYRVASKDMRGRVIAKPLRGWPTIGQFPLRFENDHESDWLISQASFLQRDIQTAETYAETLKDTVVRFAFCTPVATAPTLDYTIPPRFQQRLRLSDLYPNSLDAPPDFAHESRTRSAINFPDSRLLIFDSGKLQRLTYLLRYLQSQNSRSLIFTQMTGTLNILEQFLNLLNLPYLRLDGSTPVERRQLYAAEFNRPDSKYQCMILSSRAGGIGLNLTGASSVIFYDLDWNPQMDRQCMDRAHRIGQVRDVRVFKMVSEKTVEENILRRAEQKSLLDQAVIQEGHFTTDYEQPQKVTTGADGDEEGDEDVAAAIERFLGGGGNEKSTNQLLESVEEKEDFAAALAARKEEVQDEVDFVEKSSKGPSRGETPGARMDNDEEGRKGHLDAYMIRMMEGYLGGIPFVPPVLPSSRRDKHGRDRSHRAKRKR